ncbi:hypothetical protein PISMIDRAFT_678594, partial [Pisolithus microcarpus 441]
MQTEPPTVCRFPYIQSSSPADRHGTVIFMGINDCGRTDSYDLEPIVECILDTVHELYVK